MYSYGKKNNFLKNQGNSDQEAFHRTLVSMTSATWKRTLQTVIKKKKKANTHRHEIIWYDLVHLALMIIERNMRKIQASVIDLHSGKSRYREFCRLKRRKHEK